MDSSMIKLLLTFLTIGISSAFSQEIEFIGPCSHEPIFSQEFSPKFETIGDLTVYVLDKNKISYLGNEEGINSVFGTPVGSDAIEVLSDTDMRSYGWCFFVDGKLSDVYAHQYLLNSTIQKVQWIYSYALLKKDKWVSMCEKAYKVKPKFLCK